MTTVKKPVGCCLVGIGGYGRTWLRALDELEKEGLARLSAVVVRNPAKYAKELAALEPRGVRIFNSFADAVHAHAFDFLGISTPIQLHRPMVVEALEAGIPTLCEKPAAPTVQDVQAMLDAQRRTGVLLDIAYPMQSSSAVRAVQRAVIAGCVGKVQAVVVRCGWLREERYYQRSPWAGRVTVDGAWTLDGPINNPTAHSLYAGMFFASSEAGRVARPVGVRGELYRARPTIEGEDTACLDAEFENGSHVCFYTTVVTADKTYQSVRIDVRGDLGSVALVVGKAEPRIPVRRNDGGDLFIEHDGTGGTTKHCIANFARIMLGEGGAPLSPVEESLAFARVSNGAFDSSETIRQIPPEYVRRHEIPLDEKKYVKKQDGEKTLIYELDGIVPAMTEAGERTALFSDIGVPWAVPTQPIDLRGYSEFPTRFQLTPPR